MLAGFPISGKRGRVVPLRSRLTIVSALLLSAWLGVTAVFAQSDPLPELGDSAAQVLSPVQEKQIGQQFLRSLMRDKSYVNDPELRTYLNSVGAKIAQNAPLRGVPITVNLVQNPELNAFAVPGGYITFHTGLILTTEAESELASVMGHEIAHITQRHLPRMLAKAEASKIPAAAAILASILIGGQVGVAGLTMANATLISNQLAYTRDFEREADSIGIKLLAKADYDPAAMARFFGKMERFNGGLGEQVPEFLRTHPLSYTRIAEAEDRAAAYPARTYTSSRNFHFARAKIRALYSPRGQDTTGYFKDQAASSSGDKKDAAIYGIALSQRKLRLFDQARTTLQPLLETYPDEVTLQLARAEIDLASGNSASAVARYEQLARAHPQLAYITHYQANALLANGDAAGAKRAIRYQLRRHKEMFDLYPLLSRSNVKLGLLAEAHQTNAEFHAALGEYAAAVSSLKLALRESDSAGYLRQSITARLGQIEEILDRQQARK